jgi:hypothetical protein
VFKEELMTANATTRSIGTPSPDATPIITEFRFDNAGSLVDPDLDEAAEIDLRPSDRSAQTGDGATESIDHLVRLSSGGTVIVGGANAYQPEGPMTTFFTTGSGRGTIDSWSTRVASYRTADIISIQRVDSASFPRRADVPSTHPALVAV